MPTILAIETSSETASCALLHGDAVIARESAGVRTHSQSVLPMIQELLAEAGIALKDCDARLRLRSRLVHRRAYCLRHRAGTGLWRRLAGGAGGHAGCDGAGLPAALRRQRHRGGAGRTHGRSVLGTVPLHRRVVYRDTAYTVGATGCAAARCGERLRQWLVGLSGSVHGA